MLDGTQPRYHDRSELELRKERADLMSKDISVVVVLSPEEKQEVEAKAAYVGLSVQELMRAWVRQALKGQPRDPVQQGLDAIYADAEERRRADSEDAWRGPPDDDDPQPASDVDVDAMIANRVAEAESAGLAQPPQPYEAFGGPQPIQGAPANVRSLRRPPPQFAPANQPHHLRSL